ncbi:MAG: flagellar hook-length control protein FliK [Burkholderiaceae bacterium]|nr:MAG: flagellar hook-length control protein FliK [Burkholderiaceae bacterium]
MTITSTPANALPGIQNAGKGAGPHTGDDRMSTEATGEVLTQATGKNPSADKKSAATVFGDLLSQKLQAGLGADALDKHTKDDSQLTDDDTGSLSVTNPVADAVHLALQQIGAAVQAAQNTTPNAAPGAQPSVADSASAGRHVNAAELLRAGHEKAATASVSAPVPNGPQEAQTTPIAATANPLNTESAPRTATGLMSEAKPEVEAALPKTSAAATPLPVAAAASPATHTAPVQLGIQPVEVHSPRFAEATAERVQFAIGNKLQSAQIDLHPAELGPIRIQLQFNNQDVSINFSAAHAGTRQALEEALPRLRELLGQSGITLSETQVGQQNLTQQQPQPQQHTASQATPFSGNRTANDNESATVTVTRPLNSAQHNSGLLDTYA